MTGSADSSTSASNPYLSVQQQTYLNPYAELFAPTSVPATSTLAIALIRAPLSASFYKVQYGRPMGGNGTQVALTNATTLI